MLLTCTCLSIPAYILFWNGESRKCSDDSENYTFNDFILALSLGNLGEKSYEVNELDLHKQMQRIEMFCNTGVINSLNKHGIAQL